MICYFLVVVVVVVVAAKIFTACWSWLCSVEIWLMFMEQKKHGVML